MWHLALPVYTIHRYSVETIATAIASGVAATAGVVVDVVVIAGAKVAGVKVAGVGAAEVVVYDFVIATARAIPTTARVMLLDMAGRAGHNDADDSRMLHADEHNPSP